MGKREAPSSPWSKSLASAISSIRCVSVSVAWLRRTGLGSVKCPQLLRCPLSLPAPTFRAVPPPWKGIGAPLSSTVGQIAGDAAIPAECLSVNGLLAVGPSVVLYGRSARTHIEQDSSFMRACNRTLGIATPRYDCIASF
jgi:hypothetical protein